MKKNSKDNAFAEGYKVAPLKYYDCVSPQKQAAQPQPDHAPYIHNVKNNLNAASKLKADIQNQVYQLIAALKKRELELCKDVDQQFLKRCETYMDNPKENSNFTTRLEFHSDFYNCKDLLKHYGELKEFNCSNKIAIENQLRKRKTGPVADGFLVDGMVPVMDVTDSFEFLDSVECLASEKTGVVPVMDVTDSFEYVDSVECLASEKTKGKCCKMPLLEKCYEKEEYFSEEALEKMSCCSTDSFDVILVDDEREPNPLNVTITNKGPPQHSDGIRPQRSHSPVPTCGHPLMQGNQSANPSSPASTFPSTSVLAALLNMGPSNMPMRHNNPQIPGNPNVSMAQAQSTMSNPQNVLNTARGNLSNLNLLLNLRPQGKLNPNPQQGGMQQNKLGGVGVGPQQAGNPQQQGPMAATTKDRRTIWQGVLEFQEKSNLPQVQGQKVIHSLTCTFSDYVTTTGDSDVNADKWPSRLVLQLIPRQLIVVPNLFSTLKTASRHVLIHFNQQTEALNKLCKNMSSGLVGCIQFPTTCDIRIMVVLYMPDKQIFMGFIAHDQEGFFNSIQQGYENHRKQQHKRLLANIPPSDGSMGNQPPNLNRMMMMMTQQVTDFSCDGKAFCDERYSNCPTFHLPNLQEKEQKDNGLLSLSARQSPKRKPAPKKPVKENAAVLPITSEANVTGIASDKSENKAVGQDDVNVLPKTAEANATGITSDKSENKSVGQDGYVLPLTSEANISACDKSKNESVGQEGSDTPANALRASFRAYLQEENLGAWVHPKRNSGGSDYEQWVVKSPGISKGSNNAAFNDAFVRQLKDLAV